MNKALGAIVLVLHGVVIVMMGMIMVSVKGNGVRVEALMSGVKEEQEALFALMERHGEESERELRWLAEDRRVEEKLQEHEEVEARRYRQISDRMARAGIAEVEAEEALMGILVEKSKQDYIRSGLEYYEKGWYKQAYKAFTRALSYDGRDTTVKFYQIYSLYLASIHRYEAGEHYEEIRDGIENIMESGYEEVEMLYFGEAEMREKVREMEINIRGWRSEERNEDEGYEVEVEWRGEGMLGNEEGMEREDRE